MATRREIWPNYKDRGGNAIPKPRYRSNFSENLKKTWDLKGHLPKPKKRKWEPPIPAYPIRELLKSWALFMVFSTLLLWAVMHYVIN